MPALACADGERPAMSAARKRIAPAVGCMSPARQLKSVLFPAPLGPIRPSASCSARARSAPSTARKLPKAFTTPRASSSMATSAKVEGGPKLGEAARSEAGDRHDDDAVDDEGGAVAAAEIGVGRLLQWHQDHRADHRTEQRARAAE